MLYGSNEEYKSLNQCAIEVNNTYKQSISKQGIDQRFNTQSVRFIKSLFEEQLKNQITSQISSELLNMFNRMLVKDSTKFDIHEQHKAKYPGSGGSASKAGMCIQLEFDLKNGAVSDLTICPSTRQDSTDAKETKDKIEKDDLIIRDLGYFALDVFEHIEKCEAFFLSRLEPRVLIYQKENGNFTHLSYSELYEHMKELKQSTIEINAFIGEKKKMPVRLIVRLLPEDAYNQRMRRINKLNQKKSRKTSDKYKEYARFSFYITNIPFEKISATQIIDLYRLRWQIELVFKIWKSIFKLEKIGKMKLNRLLSLLYVKLLWILINWEIVVNLKSVFHSVFQKTLSIYKSFQTIKDNFEKFRKELKENKIRGENLIIWMIEILSEKHWLEKRKNRIGYEKIVFMYL